MPKKTKVKGKIRVNRSKLNKKSNKTKEKKDFKQEDLELKIKNLERVMHRTQKVIDEFEREEKQDRLLSMMYKDDVDAEFVKNSMGVSEEELSSLVNDLVSRGFLQFVSGDEIELTKDGVLYMKNQNSEFF